MAKVGEGWRLTNTSNPHNQFKQSIGELYMYSGSTALSIPSGVKTQLTNLMKGSQWGVISVDETNSKFIINKHGRYFANLSVSFSGDGGVTWNGGFEVNGVIQENLQIRRKLGASGDVGAASISGILELNSGDEVDIEFEHNAGVNKDITVVDCNATLVKIW
jgi:hypothetical protein